MRFGLAVLCGACLACVISLIGWSLGELVGSGLKSHRVPVELAAPPSEGRGYVCLYENGKLQCVSLEAYRAWSAQQRGVTE